MIGDEIKMQKMSAEKYLIMFLVILCFTIGIGSIYLMKIGNDDIEHIKTYINSFITSVSQISQKQVYKNSLYENIFFVVAILLSCFFKPFLLVVVACFAKKGFIMGFISASMLKCFGIKGLLVNLCYLPSVVITIPILIFLSTKSRLLYENDTNIKKKLLFRCIPFAIITITIFCVTYLLESYLTTTFMKWVSPTLV